MLVRRVHNVHIWGGGCNLPGFNSGTKVVVSPEG